MATREGGPDEGRNRTGNEARDRGARAAQEAFAGLVRDVRDVPYPRGAANARALRQVVDVWSMPVGFSLRLRAPGYMDLAVERIDDDRVSLSHYGEQNGDLMADPDMEIIVAADGSWVRPVSFRNDYARVCQAVGARPNPKLEKDLADFLAMWLRNLKGQGFGDPDPEEAARRAAARENFIERKLRGSQEDRTG